MISKNIVLFGTLIYLHCMYFVETQINLSVLYKKLLDTGLNKKVHPFCHTSNKLLWVSACNVILHILRTKEGGEYQNSLFINHSLFHTARNWCVNAEVTFEDPEDVSIIGKTSVTQLMMPCYGQRESVIPFAEFMNENVYTNDFHIYSNEEKSWMIFMYQHGSRTFKLYDWYTIENFPLISKELLESLPPVSISSDYKYAMAISSLLEAEKTTSQNMVMTAKVKKVMQFCSFFYERMPYSEQIYTPSEKLFTKETTSVQSVLIHIPGFGNNFINARDCKMKFHRRIPRYVNTSDYKLSAGPTVDSVLLLKENHDITTVDVVKKCDILEAIINFQHI